MKIIIHSNAPWTPSGYGTQTKLFAPLLAEMGHEVAISAFFGLRGGPLTWEGIKVYPGGLEAWGNDVLPAHAKAFGADAVISLVDAWVLDPRMTARLKAWYPWAPIDHQPAPPQVVEALHRAARPIAMSKHGARAMREAGLDPLYVPHGYDTGIFRPLERDAARRHMGIDEGRFMAAMVAANKGTPSRKGIPQVLRAWARFIEDHPDAVLYLHMNVGPSTGGIDVPALLETLGVPPENVRFADPYQYMLGYPEDYLAEVYNAADVLLNPSMGEGFGIPIVEAQACGCPVIVTDWTAMPELCFSGRVVPGEPFWTPQDAWQALPDVAAIVDALAWAYDVAGDSAIRRDAIEGAAAYGARRVLRDYWAPALERIADEIKTLGKE